MRWFPATVSHCIRWPKQKDGWLADTTAANAIYLDATSDTARRTFTFIRNGTSLDLLSIVFKYRPSTAGFPQQLVTNFNAAAYFGYGTDRYKLRYDQKPLNSYQRENKHFGYSFGVFLGIGAPEITPSVTQQRIEEEYYGFAVTKGVTGVLNIGIFRVGLAVGFDHLLDHNRKLWIYQGKPWIGTTVGLSLK